MKVFVQVACELDPELNLRVDRRTGQVRPEEGDQAYRVWPLGRAGVAAALSLPEAQVSVFCLGSEHEEALRHAVAAGAGRAYLLPGDPQDLPGGAVARWLSSHQPDLVIADRLAGSLAYHLGWAHLAGLAELEVQERRLFAHQHLGRGDRYRVLSALPAVIRLHPGARKPPYISRTRLKATAFPCWEAIALTSEELDSELEVGKLQAVRARTRGARKAGRSPSKASDRVKALMGLCAPGNSSSGSQDQKADDEPQTPEEMAREFVRYLKHHDLISKEPTHVSIS